MSGDIKLQKELTRKNKLANMPTLKVVIKLLVRANFMMDSRIVNE
jgi:hypothetical protein